MQNLPYAVVKTLLHYFGEEYTEENCGNCDNCLNPKKQVEAQDLLCAVIEAIIAVKENFKADYIIDILQGKETSEVQAHMHETSKYSAQVWEKKTKHGMLSSVRL